MATLSVGAAPNVVSANIISEDRVVVLSVNVGTLSAVGAATSAEQTVTVSGLAVGDAILGINKPTAQAGIGIVGSRVTAANTLGITFMNATAAGVTPTASETYLVTVYRPSYIAAKTSFEG